MVAAELSAQHSNPYRAFYGWAKLPEGRTLGVVAGIYHLNYAQIHFASVAAFVAGWRSS